MSDAKGTNNDPSMDDILASIRKIISDDEARTQAGDAAAGSPPRSDDVLLLTDLVEEPAAAAQPPGRIPPAKIDPASAAEMPQPSIVPPPPPAAASPVVPPPAPAPPAVSPMASVEAPANKPGDSTLVEAGAAGVVVSAAFDRLNQAVQESVPSPDARDRGPALGSGDRSLEDIVKDALRPMLKEWLDKNLPGMVERFVEREIVRLTRR